MSSHRTIRDGWSRAILLGALVGLPILGVGGRAAMRAIAALTGAPAALTVEGTLTVLLAGAGSGAVAGAIHRLLMVVLPRHQLLRALAFVVVLAALTIRGLHPVQPLPLALFGTLMALFAIVYLVVMRRAGVDSRSAAMRHAAGGAAFLAVVGLPSLGAAQVPAPPAAAQNPSPMTEDTRAHERLVQRPLTGITRSFEGPRGRPVELFVPDAAGIADAFDLVVHFHGAAWLPEQAVASLGGAVVAAVVNLGAGSGAYHTAFADPSAFDSLLAGVSREVSVAIGKPARIGRITLVGFSAGHGAVRAILRAPSHFARVDAVLLLDGMHTSYVPEGTVLAAGGSLDSTNLVSLTEFARAAVRGEKRFVVTHSEIFPGTFASTTETADWLLRALSLKRAPVLRWGVRGMQQLSEVHAGRFELLGFAGNSGPDHIDHLHAMPELLARTLAP
jgi:hypothetical protein